MCTCASFACVCVPLIQPPAMPNPRVLLLLQLTAAVALLTRTAADSHINGPSYSDNSLVEPPPDETGGPGGGYYRSTATGGGNYGGLVERNGTDNRKPAFRDCATLMASVREEQPAGMFVIRVQATDPDAADQIEYSFVNAISERSKFRIEPKTGNIYTSYQFDRDEPAREKEVCFFGFSP